MNPNPDSVRLMRVVDGMPLAFRELVHEFGIVIVDRMRADGYEDAQALREALETWRSRRQAQWLATNFW